MRQLLLCLLVSSSAIANSTVCELKLVDLANLESSSEADMKAGLSELLATLPLSELKSMKVQLDGKDLVVPYPSKTTLKKIQIAQALNKIEGLIKDGKLDSTKVRSAMTVVLTELIKSGEINSKVRKKVKNRRSSVPVFHTELRTKAKFKREGETIARPNHPDEVISIMDQGRIMIWNIRTGKLVLEFHDKTRHQKFQLIASPLGDRIAYRVNDGVRIVDLTTKSFVAKRQWKPSFGTVEGHFFTVDGSHRTVTRSRKHFTADRTWWEKLDLWDTETRKVLSEHKLSWTGPRLDRSNQKTEALGFFPQLNRIYWEQVENNKDYRLGYIDLSTGETGLIKGPQRFLLGDQVVGDGILPSSNGFVAVVRHHSVSIYNLKPKTHRYRPVPIDRQYGSSALSKDGAQLAAGDMQGWIHILDIKDARIVKKYQTPSENDISDIAYTRDGKYLIASDYIGFWIVEAETGQFIHREEGDIHRRWDIKIPGHDAYALSHYRGKDRHVIFHIEDLIKEVAEK